MPALRKYPQELRDRAIRLVQEARSRDPERSVNAAVVRIGQRTGVYSDTLRGWVTQAAIDSGERPGTTSSEAARIKVLEAEVKELRRANEILLAASSFFAREFDPRLPWRSNSSMIRDRFGVELICRVLTEHGVKIGPVRVLRVQDPRRPGRCGDAELVVEIERVFWDRKLGRGICDARKMWHRACDGL